MRRFGFEIKRIRKPGQVTYSRSAELRVAYERLGKLACRVRVPKLHFGCGPRVLKGWVNIDLAYEPFEKYLQFYGEKYYPAEIRADRSEFYAIDITKTGLPLPDDSVDVIFHEDFMEHLNQRDQIVFLAETLRVLRPGGVHRVNTPNLLICVSIPISITDVAACTQMNGISTDT